MFKNFKQIIEGLKSIYLMMMTIIFIPLGLLIYALLIGSSMAIVFTVVALLTIVLYPLYLCEKITSKIIYKGKRLNIIEIKQSNE